MLSEEDAQLLEKNNIHQAVAVENELYETFMEALAIIQGYRYLLKDMCHTAFPPETYMSLVSERMPLEKRTDMLIDRMIDVMKKKHQLEYVLIMPEVLRTIKAIFGDSRTEPAPSSTQPPHSPMVLPDPPEFDAPEPIETTKK